MSEPVKVRFRKVVNGKIHLSGGYYLDQADWDNRNNTFKVVEFTEITKPPPKKKEAKKAP